MDIKKTLRDLLIDRRVSKKTKSAYGSYVRPVPAR